jgi:hypothetical protein
LKNVINDKILDEILLSLRFPPKNIEMLKNEKVVFLFDGLDEID